MKNLFNLKFIFLTIILCNIIVDISHKILLQNIAFKSFNGNEMIVWVSIINLMLLIPFVMLFSTSGYLSDKYKKNDVFIKSAILNFGLSIVMFIAYSLESFYLAIGILFLLGIQAAIYSPAKFGLIQTIFSKENLNKGNSLVQSIGMIGILATMAVYSIGFESLIDNNKLINNSSIENTKYLMSSLGYLIYSVIFISFLEMVLSLLFMKNINVVQDETKELNINKLLIGGYLKENIINIINNKNILLPIIGLSVFWSISQGLIAVYPAFAKEYIGITNTFKINMIIAFSGIGIAIGSSYYTIKKETFINTNMLPFATIGMAIILLIVTNNSNNSLFFLGLSFLLFGIFSGLFVVPLNSLIQFNSNEKTLGTILAGNNFFQSMAMITMLIFTTSMAILETNSQFLMYCITTTTILGSLYTIYKLPQPILYIFVRFFIGLKFKLKVNGLENISMKNGVLLLGNHVSWIDWAILQLSIPKQINFVMFKGIYDKWYLNWLLRHLPIIPISGASSRGSLKLIAEKLNEGEIVALFPEGMISWNGHLGEFKRGFEIVLANCNENVDVNAFFIHGLWESMFSRASKEYIQKNGTRDVTISFSNKIEKPTTSSVKAKIQEISVDGWKTRIDNFKTLQEEIYDTMYDNGNQIMVADSTGLELSGHKFLGVSFALSRKLNTILEEEQNIGILMPSTSGGILVNMSVLSLGKTLININYTSDINSILNSLKLAEVKYIISSQKFLTRLKAKGILISEDLLKENGITIIFLEDIMTKIYKVEIISYILMLKILPSSLIKSIFLQESNKEDTALILFSSGSEGTPKGIELSHNNLLANIKQCATILNLKQNDVILGSLPLFHAFGITITTFLPLVEGVLVVAHPDPTDGHGIGKLVHKYKATIMFGTSTFFRLYSINKKVNPLMFDSLRLIVAGAEKLNKKIKDDFNIKFNKTILEGYGATETSPVATCNIPNVLTNDLDFQLGNKDGSVGLPVPGTNIVIVDPSDLESYKKDQNLGHPFTHGANIKFLDIEQEGMILISGPQVMKGYYKNLSKTNDVTIDIDGKRHYITGDKGKLDKDGFLIIVDRYSRFAKIGGEMISLSTLESKFLEAISLIPNYEIIDFIATTIKDEKKGEAIIMLVTKNCDLNEIKPLVNNMFDNKLMIPNKYIQVDVIPKLGSGKKDFKGAEKLALELVD